MLVNGHAQIYYDDMVTMATEPFNDIMAFLVSENQVH